MARMVERISTVYCNVRLIGSCPVGKLKCIVLERMAVQSVGDLEGLCPMVEELHLSYNQISHCDDVSLHACTYRRRHMYMC